MICECGCNLPTKIGNRFIHGHNIRGKHIHVGKPSWNKGLTKENNEIVNGRAIDHLRTKELKDAGYKIIRFWDGEVDIQALRKEFV